jgi:hypothetical protein
MKAVLEIGINDLNIQLVEILTALFKKDITEVVIRKSAVTLEPFDKTQKLEDVMQSLKEHGHNELFLKEIENGLLNSSIYTKQ